MILTTTPEQTRAILGAMRRVGTIGGTAPLTAVDRLTIDAAWRHVFRGPPGFDVDALPMTTPAALAAALPDRAARQYAIAFLAVMALVDGTVDAGKIALVVEDAAALDVHPDYLRDLTETVQRHIEWVTLDMMRHNVESIAGLAWDPKDPARAFLPYEGPGADPALAARYEALGALAGGTFGRAFWEHYTKNRYPFPGAPGALNAKFATPHDSTHVLSGYSTSYQGELLVSTFTASMHKTNAMSGHILPVIFSWHLGIELNPVAGSHTGSFDPEKFWVAWDRGSAVTTDVFAAAWDFWAVVGEDLEALRRRYGIPPLEPRYAALGDVFEPTARPGPHAAP
jgi:hypothetical protein